MTKVLRFFPAEKKKKKKRLGLLGVIYVETENKFVSIRDTNLDWINNSPCSQLPFANS